MSLSLFKTKEFGSSSRPSHSAAQYANHSFIAFLALAQRLEIPFLPITWQALRENLGQGGQARVSQAAADVQTSFAFKRFRADSVSNVDKDTPFQAVINEMIMLSHHAIRDHLYIVTLEGICWDIPWDLSTEIDQVWPVLVFEKSIHGDLLQFVKARCGSSLSTREKLKLCTDIGIAIRDMHLNHIIHGDIKHQNVLIFKDENDDFIAKIADFGFSTDFKGENDNIFFPRSRPWNAPEYHHRSFSPEEAKRMDIYSFGLLCFWLILGTSDPLPLAPWMQYENAESISLESDSKALEIFECLKENEDNNLLRWIAWLIDHQDDFNDGERNNLKKFFRFTLVRKPNQRNLNYDELFSSLAPHRSIQPPMGRIKIDLLLAEENFEIQPSFVEFYTMDFRLRIYIAISLLSISRKPPESLTRHISPQKAAFQLAVCYKIGFGVPRDSNNAHSLLEKSLQSWEDLEDEIELLSMKHNIWMRKRPTGIYLQISKQGYAPFVDFPQYYRERGILEKAKRNYIHEIQYLREEFKDTHAVSLMLKLQLADLYNSEGQWAKAEDLLVEVVKIRRIILGVEDSSTLASMSNLALVYGNQRKWAQAEELGIELVETSKKVYGLEDNRTLTGMLYLASTYRNQRRWIKAEETEIQVMEIRKRDLGLEHPSALRSMSSLALTYRSQGCFAKAEDLQIQLTETRKKILGPEHPNTLTSLSDLALIYGDQKQWVKAEALQIQVMEASKRVLGLEHPTTLTSMSNLSWTYRTQRCFVEAEALQLQVIETRKKVLGLENPFTLISLFYLTDIYKSQGEWAKAAALQAQIPKKIGTISRQGHPDVLARLDILDSL